MQELEIIDPGDYKDTRKKKMLIENLCHTPGVSYSLQKCRETGYMTYAASAAYLRKNGIIYDYEKKTRAPTRLMHVDKVEDNTKSLEEVSRIFTTMAEEEGLEITYRMFNTRTFRENMSIPTAIWNELEPAIKQKIGEIRKNLRDN